MYVCQYHRACVEVTGQLADICSLLSSCGFQGSNSGHRFSANTCTLCITMQIPQVRISALSHQIGPVIIPCYHALCSVIRGNMGKLFTSWRRTSVKPSNPLSPSRPGHLQWRFYSVSGSRPRQVLSLLPESASVPAPRVLK